MRQQLRPYQTLLYFVNFFLLWLAALSSVLAIWPQPSQLGHGDGVLWLSKDVEFKFHSHVSTSSSFQIVLALVRR